MYEVVVLNEDYRSPRIVIAKRLEDNPTVWGVVPGQYATTDQAFARIDEWTDMWAAAR